VEAASGEHDRAERAVGAAVEEDRDVHRGDPAVPRDARAVADDRGVALGRGRHVLEAVVDELHRAARLQGEERGVAGDDRRVVLLAPETAARLGLDDPDPVGRKTQQADERLVHVVGALERPVHRDAAVGRNRDHPLRLEVDVLLASGPVLALDDDVGRGESSGELALLDGDLLEGVRRTFRVEHGLARPLVEADRGGPQHLAVLVGEQEDRLLGVPDLALHEVRLVVLDERDDVASRDVRVVDDREARAVEVEVDGLQLAAGHRRADGPPVEHAREAEVIDVARRSEGLCQSFRAGDAATHDAHGA
jgi:hypothetical protein